jgi:hypothetical protein
MGGQVAAHFLSALLLVVNTPGPKWATPRPKGPESLARLIDL